jgi:hypothetical protein
MKVASNALPTWSANPAVLLLLLLLLLLPHQV